jgi:hypothetical protein
MKRRLTYTSEYNPYDIQNDFFKKKVEKKTKERTRNRGLNYNHIILVSMVLYSNLQVIQPFSLLETKIIFSYIK